MKKTAITVLLMLLTGCASSNHKSLSFEDITNTSSFSIPESQYNSSKNNKNRTLSDFKYIFRNWEKYHECLHDFKRVEGDVDFEALCMKAAVDGYFASQRILGFEYASKRQDLLKSIEWYESAVLGGDKIAMNSLGLIYAGHHKIVQRNIKLAIGLLESSGDYATSFAKKKLVMLKQEIDSSP